MRKLAVFAILLVGFISVSDAAAPVQRRGQATTSGGTTGTAVRGTSAARSATSVRAPAANTAASSARAATGGRTTVARSATPTAAKTPTVAARAAATQKVIGTGTKVAAATKNTVVNEVCQQKFEGCMDSFCMLDNATGGRCICSNRAAELDSVLAEIEKLDQQSYQMATFGVEKIEMGADADQVIANANAAAQSVIKKQDDEKKSARRTLDLSLWDATVFEEDEDIFGDGAQNSIEGKTGDALHAAAADLCAAQIPECVADISMLKLMYAQRVKSDCTAYENSLKQQKNASANKLAAAERALREAALEQYRSANKYDLGQCTVEFKKCMATTAGCNNDFTGCVGIAAAENARATTGAKKKQAQYTIKGSATQITIAASTYDALESKKPMCESVTNSCVAVKDQVWSTFLREVGPQLKTAELMAESNLRTSCIANISACFQKACRDTMDPNDPDGSYDMCLSRPETVRSLCKVELDPCIEATGGDNESPIWDFVKARLASMRVDSCTTEVKECLQSQDRCGEDYTQCVGLGLNDVKKMCPVERLVGCQKDGQLTSMDEIDNIIMGVYLNIDNSLLNECTNALNEKMLEVCGDTLSCENGFTDDNLIGTESLVSYKNSDGDYVIEGLISFGNVKIERKAGTNDDEIGEYEININDYKSHLNENDPTVSRVIASLQSTANKISQKINIIAQDPTINMCINGRDMSQIRGGGSRRDRSTARYPHLMDASIMAIMNSGLEQANKNYSKKYNDLVASAIEEQNDSIKQALCAAMASNPNAAPNCLETDENGLCTKYDHSSPFDDYFGNSDKIGMSNDGLYALRYVIDGASLDKQLAAAQQGRGEFVQTDSYGNMLGRIDISSTYSPQTNTCTLTTTTTNCSNAEAIITTNTTKECKKGGLSIVGGSGCSGGGGVLGIGGSKMKVTSEQTYHGTACTEFDDPIVTTNAIKM